MIWLIITDTNLVSVSTDIKQYHEHILTGSEIYGLRIINPSFLYTLLTTWYPAGVSAVSLSFAGKSVLESQTGTPKNSCGHLIATQQTPEGFYTACIPGSLYFQYQCILTSLGIRLQTVTTNTMLAYAATQSFNSYSLQTLIEGCYAYETI